MVKLRLVCLHSFLAVPLWAQNAAPKPIHLKPPPTPAKAAAPVVVQPPEPPLKAKRSPQDSPQTPSQDGGGSGTGSALSHAEKIHRLTDMFYDVDPTLALVIRPTQTEYEALKPFSVLVHQWSLQTPATSSDLALESAVRKTYPSLGERYLRSMQGKVELIQQPKTALIENPTTLQVTAAPNPDNLLLKVSGVFTYSEYVPTPADVQTQAKAVHDANIDIRSTGGGLCTHVQNETDAHKVRDCFLRTGFRNVLLRDLSGVKGIVNYAQNPEVQQQLLVPDTISNQNRIFSGEVDFDPSKLFLTGSDWLAAYGAAQYYGTTTETRFNDVIRAQCEKALHQQLPSEANGKRLGYVSEQCMMRLARPHGAYAWLAAFTPQVVYTIKSQFDFIKNQGDLVPAPYATKRLGDLTLTVDLTRLIATAKSRTDALATLVAAQKNTPVTPVDPARKDLDKQVQLWASEPESLDKADVYEALRLALVSLRPSMQDTPH